MQQILNLNIRGDEEKNRLTGKSVKAIPERKKKGKELHINSIFNCVHTWCVNSQKCFQLPIHF